MLTVEQAQNEILSQANNLASHMCLVTEALGAVLAEEIRARRDIPPWDNSAMDGYAVIADDLKHAGENTPVTLSQSFIVPAGGMPTETVQAGQTARIFTGAPMPQGADAVVMQENTKRQNSDELKLGDKLLQVDFLQAPPVGNNIRRQGEDVKVGEIVCPVGTVITPAVVAMAASVGRTLVKVVRSPQVAIISTGDELCEPDCTPGANQIYNSNAWGIQAAVKLAGGEPRYMGISPDDPEQIKSAVKAALECDVVVTIGGVSVGDYDYVKECFEANGVNLDFWKVAIKPGKPLAYGKKDQTHILGLPGNPVSSLVTFELFGRPLIKQLMGHADLFRRQVNASLMEPLKTNTNRQSYIQAQLEVEGFDEH
jgi:molybdopterin molybdotransferase